MIRALLAVILMAAVAVAPASAKAPAGGDESPNCTKCGKQTYGTSVQWTGSPSDAAAKAKKEEKLVFVLHVSGYFEDANFT